ncbi:MAG: hypothetical protein J0L72_09895 [Armatimonadetes bacterium]|nr:hypothetical protein [Armatimonadota bacterium]
MSNLRFSHKMVSGLVLLGLMAAANAAELPDVKVSLECRAIPLSAVLADLSAKTGTKLLVESQLGKQIYVVQAKDVSSKDLLGRIALTSHAAWTEVDGAFRLVLSPQDEKAMRSADQAMIAQKLREAIDGSKEFFPADGMMEVEEATPTTMPPNTEEETEEERKFRENYVEIQKLQSELKRDLRAAIDVDRMARLNLFERVGYSTQPGSGLTMLSTKFKTAMVKFNQASAKIGQARQRTLSRIVVSYSRNDPYSYNYKLTGVSSDNKVIFRDELKIALAVSNFFGGFGSPPKIAEFPLKLNKPDSVVEMTEELKAMSEVIESITNGVPPPVFRQTQIKEFFGRPDLHDPLGLSTSSAVVAMAKDQALPTVANLCDETFAMEVQALGETAATKTKQLAEAFWNIGTQKVETKDGWLLIEPMYPSISLEARISRDALGALIRIENRDGSVGLEPMIGFANTYPELAPGITLVYLFLAAPSALDFSMISGGESMSFAPYRFYGALDGRLRPPFDRGEPIPFSALNMPQRSLYLQCLTGIDFASGQFQTDMFGTILSTIEGRAREEQAPPYVDVVEAIPALDQTGFVRGKSMSETVVRGVGEQFVFGPFSILNAETYAFMKMSFREGEEGDGMMFAKFDRYRIGMRQNVLMEFLVSPQFGASKQVSGTRMTGDPAGVPETGFPREFMAKVRQVIERMNQAEPAQEAPMGAPPTR